MTAPWIREEMREALRETLRERKFDEAVNDAARRVEAIRHNSLAHRLLDKPTGTPKEALAGVSLEDLRRLFDAAHLLFGALSFGAAYITLTGDLTPAIVQSPKGTCLENVLNAVLRDSSFVNQPERRSQWWPEQRKYMRPDSIRVMNELRARIGLPEA
jgi:hypothetical protein